MPRHTVSIALLKAKHAFHCAFACFEWLSAPLYFASRHVVFRFVFLPSVSATRNKARKHEKHNVVSKRVFCLPSDVHLRQSQAVHKHSVKISNSGLSSHPAESNVPCLVRGLNKWVGNVNADGGLCEF
jgi:hypothetical protein